MNTSTTYPITTTGTTEFVPRETLATFTDYRSAQSMVDRLSDAGFPVATARITGTGLPAASLVVEPSCAAPCPGSGSACS